MEALSGVLALYFITLVFIVDDPFFVLTVRCRGMQSTDSPRISIVIRGVGDGMG